MVQPDRSDVNQTNPAHGIAVLGAGAIGTAVTKALLDRGHSVRVWNRSRAPVDALVEAGAVRAASVQDAVDKSDLVLVCLTDFEAVRAVLADPIVVGGRQTTLVTLTTGTPRDAVDLQETLRPQGIDYIDAGVQAAPADVGTDRATFIYAGSERGFRSHRSVLEILGDVTWLGEDIGASATWDLALFGLWYDAQLGLLRALDLVSDSREARQAFAHAAGRQLGHVVAETVATADELETHQYPRGPASLDEHLVVLHQLRAARTSSRLGDGGLSVPTRAAEALQAAGLGELGLNALADSTLPGS